MFDGEMMDGTKARAVLPPIPGSERNRVVMGIAADVADDAIARGTIDMHAIASVAIERETDHQMTLTVQRTVLLCQTRLEARLIPLGVIRGFPLRFVDGGAVELVAEGELPFTVRSVDPTEQQRMAQRRRYAVESAAGR